MTDAEFNDVLKELKCEVRKELIGKHVQNKERMDEINKSLELFKEIIECDGIKLRVDEPFIGSADIMIRGEKIHIKNPALFSELLRLSDVSEIVPMIDKIIQLNITYYGTSRKVGD